MSTWWSHVCHNEVCNLTTELLMHVVGGLLYDAIESPSNFWRDNCSNNCKSTTLQDEAHDDIHA